MKASINRDHCARGFTLLELLVVISIMALLASLTLMGFRHASNQASRNRTTATHRAIMSALENYHSDNAEYPEPRSQGQDVQFGTTGYNIAGAMMLYQALSGDGSDEIKTSGGGGSGSSDGIIKDDEINEAKWKEIPKEVILKTSNGWMLVDGFGHPFQYTYPQRQSGKEQGTQSSNAVNTTYDLWSFAEDDKHTKDVSLGSKQDTTISGKWIKNW